MGRVSRDSIDRHEIASLILTSRAITNDTSGVA